MAYFSCENVYPFFSHGLNHTFCGTVIQGQFWFLVCSACITFSGLVVITLRTAWKDVVDCDDDSENHQILGATDAKLSTITTRQMSHSRSSSSDVDEVVHQRTHPSSSRSSSLGNLPLPYAHPYHCDDDSDKHMNGNASVSTLTC